MNAAVLVLAVMAPAAPPPAPDVKETIRNGLKWLAEHQQEDGSWAGDRGYPATPITAMAGLAFLMEGSTLTSGTYAPNLRKAVAWFERRAGTDGRLATLPTEQFQYIQGHTFGMMFLVSAHDVDTDAERAKRIAKLLDRAVAFSVKAQTASGGWGAFVPGSGFDADDTHSTALTLQALFAVRKAGFAVPEAALRKGVAHLVKATNRAGEVIYSTAGGVTPVGGDGQPASSACAAVALLASQELRPGVLRGWVKHTATTGPQQLVGLKNTTGFGLGYTLLAHLQTARVYFALGEDGHRNLDPRAEDAGLMKWSAHRAALFKNVKETQGKDGSWADGNFGPAFTTALALVILQLDNEYVPALSR
jgi:hypothetical protein